MTFCNQTNITPVHTSESTLLLFVSYLASLNLSYTTIKVYLSGLRSIHVAAGNHDSFTKSLTPRLHQVLKGIGYHITPRVRHPITIQLMEGIKTVLLKRPHSYHNIIL